ncbi:MAG: histidine phosphatase family protein, partial [Nanoarchaeota archaeon]|nr:histidine phosphatase family protein [Nanoarchaeota archaeon]
MKLILVRHGQTKENKNKIWQGQSEGTLSEEGEEQARKLAKKLEKESIDVIYCSDLQRTKNTIKPFLEKNNRPIKYVEALRERRLGVLEGSTTEQVGKYLAENKIGFETCNFETGETFYEMRERLAKFYESIA